MQQKINKLQSAQNGTATKRNKKTFPTDAELPLASFYEELIDEVLAEAAVKNVTRQEAVELATIAHAVRVTHIQRYGKDNIGR